MVGRASFSTFVKCARYLHIRTNCIKTAKVIIESLSTPPESCLRSKRYRSATEAAEQSEYFSFLKSDTYTASPNCDRFVNGIEIKGEKPLMGHLSADLSTGSVEAIILAL